MACYHWSFVPRTRSDETSQIGQTSPSIFKTVQTPWTRSEVVASFLKKSFEVFCAGCLLKSFLCLSFLALLARCNFVPEVKGASIKLHSYKHQLSHSSCSFQLEAENDVAVLVGTVSTIITKSIQVVVLSGLHEKTSTLHIICKLILDSRQCIVLQYYTGCYCETSHMGVMGLVMAFRVKLYYQDCVFMLSYFPHYPNISTYDIHSNFAYLPEILDPNKTSCKLGV